MVYDKRRELRCLSTGVSIALTTWQVATLVTPQTKDVWPLILQFPLQNFPRDLQQWFHWYIDWLNSFIFVIADNVQYRYKTQQYHTEHEDKMALVTKNFLKPIIYMCL